MKAVIWTAYGPPDVLQVREVEKPTPQDQEVLIKIHATTVTAGDCELRSLKLPLYFALPMRMWLGFGKPSGNRIPGTELAGEIEAVGKEVKRFKAGDQVFGSAGLGFGTCAEYRCLAEEPAEGALALKPANMSYAEAAAVPMGGLEALHFLRQANIRPGERILIIGAGGSIGTFGIQLAKHHGAQVTAVDSTTKLDMLRSTGADRVIDYTREDYANSGETYDVVFDVVGKSSLAKKMRLLKPGGRLLLANPGLFEMLGGEWGSGSHGKRVIKGTTSYRTDDLVFLSELIEAGQIRTVIDRSFPLEQIAEAHRYVESGQKKGNVVITVGEDGENPAGAAPRREG